MDITPGQRLGRYEIRAKLGEGGMGEVYLALDTELERSVALKILPAEVASDQQRMSRFVQEAKAASSLNHPNILTIHEIGRADSIPFIAMEYVDGVTLRQHSRATQMRLGEVLDVSIQIASALSAAHAAGIIHRDIKPENAMLRADGYVKVLDFGLAKLVERPPLTNDPEASTQALVNTAPGVVLGTVNYMSPEQVRGEEVDARTDVWSLGCVLYEMVTGHAPFEGATPSHVIVSVLEKEPPPMLRYAREVPEALEWIVTKALTKDREGRYQTVKELLVDLRRLKQRLELEVEIERSSAPGMIGSWSKATTGSGRAGAGSASGSVSVAPTAEVGAAHPTTSVEYLVTELKQHQRGVMLVLASLVLAAAVGFALYLYLDRRHTAPFHAMKLTRLTNTGKVTIASISPDGNYVVHASDDGGRQSLWIRQVATSSHVQILPPAEVRYQGLTFSRDGNYIYYVAHEKGSPLSTVQQIPTLGGTPKKIIEDVDSPIAFSADGRAFAFIRNYPGRGETVLHVASADGGGEQKLATRKWPERFEWGDAMGPAWSPDGKVIACPAAGMDAGAVQHTVVAVAVEGGAQRAVTARRWPSAGQVAWLSGGGGLLFIAAEHTGGAAQVWHISYPEGEARKVTNDLNNYTGVSLSADSAALVTVQADTESKVWVAPNAEAGGARQVTSGKEDGLGGISWTPEGSVIYTSYAGGNSDLWSVDDGGGRQRQLTSDTRLNSLPSVSADGRYIVFISDRTGAPHLWRINSDGGGARQLSEGAGEDLPYCSPDGRWVVYFNHGCNCLWKVATDGGGAAQLTDKLTSKPAISPEGELIACTFRETPTAPYRLGIISFADGQLVKVFDIPRTASINNLRWTPDGRGVAYVDTRAGISNLWSQPVDGGAPRQLTDFKSDHIFFFDWSRDGKQLALARGTQTSDAVLISDFK